MQSKNIISIVHAMASMYGMHILCVIGASLSEPHTYRTAVQKPPDIYIIMGCMHVIIIRRSERHLNVSCMYWLPALTMTVVLAPYYNKLYYIPFYSITIYYF